MKTIKYSQDVDILLLRLSKAPVEHAEETDGIITHYSADGKPVILEIQGAREFLIGSVTSVIKGEEVKLP